MTIKELRQTVAKKAGTTQVVTRGVLNALIETIGEQMAQGNKVDIQKFASFYPSIQRGKTGIVPRTKTVYKTNDKAIVRCKISEILKRKANVIR